MHWIKAIIVTAILGFYFLSITPIHFYAHDTDLHLDNNPADCTLVTLIQAGQGNYVHSDCFVFTTDKISPIIAFQEILFFESFISIFQPTCCQLRAPPVV